MNTWQNNIAERTERFKAFHRRENERPLFGFFKGSEYPLFRYPFSRSVPEDRPLLPADFNVAAFVADTERLFLEHEACGGKASCWERDHRWTLENAGGEAKRCVAGIAARRSWRLFC